MSTTFAAAVSERAARLRDRIAGTGRDPDAITVVAVTKGFGADVVAAARAAGFTDLGENYGQELIAKQQIAPDARWHFLGQVQRRKVRDMAGHVAMWHSIDRAAEGAAVSEHSPGASVLAQVNLTGEPQKEGVSWSEVEPLVAQLREMPLDLRGLMGVGPAGPPEHARTGFRRLAALAASLGLPEVSMGMTGDLEVALEEGATIIRVGTALFGPRPAKPANRGPTDARR